MGKNFLGLDGLKHFWSKAKSWIAEQITAEVTAKIAEIVANAPEDLDTLKEIADWIKNHANDASAMNTAILANTEAISGKADKSHTHTKSEITDFPTSLKNPNALTVNGKTYDGSSVVSAGVQTIENGGTGATTAKDAFMNLANGLSEDVNPIDTEHIIFKNTSGTNWGLYTLSHFWEYIKGKISSVLGLTKDNYGGKSAKSSFLDEYVGAGGTRLTSGNIVPKDSSEYGGMRKDVVTSSMTDSGRPGLDGHLLTMFWDSDGRWDNQLFISNDEVVSPILKLRQKLNKTDYGPWVDLITSNNIGSQTVSKAGTADKTVNDITIDIPYAQESGQYVIPLGNILPPGSPDTESPYNWDITGFFSIIRPAGHSGSHIKFEAGHGYSHDWTTYAYLDAEDFENVTTSIKAFQYNGKWWLGLCITTRNQGYSSKMTVTYSRGLPATPTCILFYSMSNGVVNKEINDSIQDIPSSWWRQRTIYNPTSFSNTLHVYGSITPRQGDGATVSIGREDGNITIGDTNNNNAGNTVINNDCKMSHDLEVFGECNFVGPCFFNDDMFVHSNSLFPSGYIPRTYYMRVINLSDLTTKDKALLKKLFAFIIFKRVSNINCTFSYKSTSTSVDSYINVNGYGYTDYEGVITIDDSDNIILDSDFNYNWCWLTGCNDDGDYICLDAFDAAYKILNNDWSFFDFLFVGNFTLLEKV